MTKWLELLLPVLEDQVSEVAILIVHQKGVIKIMLKINDEKKVFYNNQSFVMK